VDTIESEALQTMITIRLDDTSTVGLVHVKEPSDAVLWGI